jgi:integrase
MGANMSGPSLGGGRDKRPDLERTPDGNHRTRLRYGKGLRGRFLITLTDEAAAERRAVKMRELAELLARAGHSARAPIILEEAGKAPTAKDFDDAVRIAEGLCAGKGSKTKRATSAVTFAAHAEKWTDGTLARDYPDHVPAKKTADLDASRLRSICSVSIAPGLTFGALPLASVTLDHCQAVMANLPDSAKRPATRRGYAQILHRVLELAVFPCRLLDASPLPRGFMPKVGKPPSFAYLYPSEDAELLACPRVPLCRRMLWGTLDREGMRTGEAIGLRVGTDVDLDRGIVKLDATKTGTARTWAMDPDVAAALRAFVKLRGLKRGDLLFSDDDGSPFNVEDLAPLLRADLKAAGVDRAELHESGENTRQLRAHDLRGTFVTLSLANGRTETWVADRTGHTSSTMINRYRRAARSATELGLGPLAPLSSAVPELAPSAVQGGPEGGPDGQNRKPADVANTAENKPQRVDSSVGQSSGFLIRWSWVRVPVDPLFDFTDLGLSSAPSDRPFRYRAFR